MLGSLCRRPKSKRALPGDRLRLLIAPQWSQHRSRLMAIGIVFVLLGLSLHTGRFRNVPEHTALIPEPDIELGWDAPRWLRDYVRFCREPDAESTQYLVWSCTDQHCSGVGDRTRGMLTAFFLSVGTGRKFRIHSVKPVNLNTALQPAWIDWSTDAEKLFYAGPERVRVHGYNDSIQYARDTRAQRIASLFTTAMELYPLYTAPEFADNFYGDTGRVNADNWDVLATWAWRVLFRPTPELESEIAVIKADAALSDTDFIAVHVRRGGHWGDWLRHSSDAELAQFVDCAVNMTRSAGRDVLVYVASDDVDVKQQFRSALPAVRYDPRPPMHIEKTEQYAEQLHIWAEFVVIGEARCIVASLSGFSLWPVMTTRDPQTAARCWARYDRCSMKAIAKSMDGPVLAYDAPSANDADFGIVAQ